MNDEMYWLYFDFTLMFDRTLMARIKTAVKRRDDDDKLRGLTLVTFAFIADFSQLSGPTLHVFGHASNTIELINTYSVIVANVRQAKNTNDTKGAKVTLLV
jgi:hypothetical protein